MPKTKIDYQKTIVYKIVCNDLNIKDLYIGCTTDFKRRKNEHKNWSSTQLDGLYKCIYNNGGWSNWSMIEIEKYPCNDGNEARKQERFWMEKLNATLNLYKPILTNDERQNYLINRKKEREEILNNNDVLKWFNDNYIKTNNSKDELKMKEIYMKFKEDNNKHNYIPYKFFFQKLEALTTTNNHKTKIIKFFKYI